MKMIRDCFEQEVGECGSIEMVELRELQDMVDEGYPSDDQLERYEELARKYDPDRLNIRLEIPKDGPTSEEVTRYEHNDRPLDDRLNRLEYDGNEDERGYLNMGKAVSYATMNHRWIKSPSPFVKGDKVYNRKVYQFLAEKLEKREWEKVSGAIFLHLLSFHFHSHHHSNDRAAPWVRVLSRGPGFPEPVRSVAEKGDGPRTFIQSAKGPFSVTGLTMGGQVAG